MVVGWNRLSPCPELEGEDVVPAGVSMSVGGIEVIDWSREDVDVLLHSLIGFGVVLVGDFHFQEIPSLVGWVEEPVVILLSMDALNWLDTSWMEITSGFKV